MAACDFLIKTIGRIKRIVNFIEQNSEETYPAPVIS